METNDIIKKIDLISEKLRSDYVEKLNSIIKEAFYEIDSKNKESLSVMEEKIQFEVAKFEDELQSILKEAMDGIEKRKATTNEKLESSEKTLSQSFSDVFEKIYRSLKEFLS